jgi:DNA-binding CsgD family transcriptional regulator
LALVAEGRSYLWISRDLCLSKNTVAGIVVRAQVDTVSDTEPPALIMPSGLA